MLMADPQLEFTGFQTLDSLSKVSLSKAPAVGWAFGGAAELAASPARLAEPDAAGAAAASPRSPSFRSGS